MAAAPARLPAYLRRRWPILGTVLFVALTAVAGWAIHSFAHDVNRMAWDCGGAQCASDDVAGLTLPLALMAGAGAVVAGTPVLGVLAPGVTLAVLGAGLYLGTRAAVDDGYSPAGTVGFPVVAAIVLMTVGGLLVVVWSALRLRRLAVRT